MKTKPSWEKCRVFTASSVVLPAFLVGILLAACTGSLPTLPANVTESTKNPLPEPGASAAGKPLFSIHCAMCHGNDGKGEGMAGGSLAIRPTDLTAESIISAPDGKIFLVIKNGIQKNGKQTMPPTRKITDEQIWQLVAYMRSMAKR